MIYAYIRVSTDKQTVENQRFEINRFAKQRDFQIDVWVEETVSGTRSAKDRKLGVLLKRIKKGDTLIVSEISRLGRRLMEVMSILNACMLKNVILLTVKEKYELGNNIQSQILAFAFSLSAQIERDLISQRTREGLARRIASGQKLGRPMGGHNSKYKLTGKEEKIKQSLGGNWYRESCVELSLCSLLHVNNPGWGGDMKYCSLFNILRSHLHIAYLLLL